MSRPLHVLIAEDDSDLLECYMEILNQEGFVATASKDLDTAWGALKAGKTDVFLCDIHLGTHDAFVLIDRARREFPDLFVIAISGRVLDGYEERSKAAGAHVYLAKPFLLNELVTTLHHLHFQNDKI